MPYIIMASLSDRFLVLRKLNVRKTQSDPLTRPAFGVHLDRQLLQNIIATIFQSALWIAFVDNWTTGQHNSCNSRTIK
jgi:hypothetical protein